MATTALIRMVALVSFSAASAASAQSVLPPAADAFVAAANSLARSAEERVDLGRASMRLRTLRAALTERLLVAGGGEKLSLAVDWQSLLCDPRVANVEIAARRNYIQAVAGKVEATGKPSRIDNLQSALAALFAGQSLDITAGVPSTKELDVARKQILERCQRDIGGFTLAYYGRNLIAPEQVAKLEAAPLIFGGIGALIDAIVGVVTPAVVEGAKIVDEERRRAAVLRFLGNPDNVKKIQDSGMALAAEVSSFTWNKRLVLAGSFYEQSTVLRATQIDISRNDSCKGYFASGTPTTPDKKSLTDDFILCWRAVWAQIETPVGLVLKSAEQYDQLADIGDTDNARKAFEPLAKSLSAISGSDENDLAKFWGWATRLAAFAQKVEATFSKENRQKIDNAIDNVVKAF